MIYTEKSTNKYTMERMEKFMSKVAVVHKSGGDALREQQADADSKIQQGRKKVIL